MKKIAILATLLALTCVSARAYTEVAGFDGPTWYDRCESFAGGYGTENNPYIIATAGQLAQLAYDVNENGETYADKYFRLEADISLNAREDYKRLLWVPIGISEERSFKGTLTNPDGHTISDLLISATGTAKTAYFGLVGYLNTGTIDGIKLQNAEMQLKDISGDYCAGLLCGMMKADSYITNCEVEAQVGGIAATGISGTARIGGLVGQNKTYNADIGKMQSCLARVKLSLTGSGGIAYAGGVAGSSRGSLYDCHAVVDMHANGLSTSKWNALGGLVGSTGNDSSHWSKIQYCSTAGDIVADGMTRTGGLFGSFALGGLTMNYCATAVTISGGHTLGGMIGYLYVRNRADSSSLCMHLDHSLCRSYVDGRDATYVGGLFGDVEYSLLFKEDTYFSYYKLTGGTEDGVCYFTGTMTRPTASDGLCGTILGHATNLWHPEGFGKFYYFKAECNFPLSGEGLDLKQYTNPRDVPDDDGYGAWDMPWGSVGSSAHPEPAAKSIDDITMCYTDIYRLCALEFYVSNDRKIIYPAYDVTVDFSIEDIVNSTTGELKAVFTVPDDATCVRVEDKHVYPIDPGEVVVSVKWNGLERKEHLDINYGRNWTGTSNETFDAGDGTPSNPYLIHNAEQLYAATHATEVVWEGYTPTQVHKYDKPGVCFKLVNDIFLNTHLNQKDGSVRSDATAWVPEDWQASLDGDGHTLYGLYVNKDGGGASGLFANLSGTVANLAIVDSYVRAAGSSDGISAGIVCGTMKEGASITNCLVHGALQSNGKAGAIAGTAEATNTTIADCFADVHIGWGSATYYAGAGLVYDTPAVLSRCFFSGKVESYGTIYGLTKSASTATSCYFDYQMMSTNLSSQTGAKSTAEMLSSALLTGDKWQQADGSYPMLRAFAATPYGRLLAMPVSFIDGNRAGYVTYIFEFPTDDVLWSALYGQQYIDVINECGAASLVNRTGSVTEMLIGEETARPGEGECTRAIRTLPLNIRAGLTDFRFIDPVARSAAEKAFDANGDGILILRELATATNADFKTKFNPNATGLQHLPEMRYFTGITNIEKGMLSDLPQLEELQLPKRLTTLSTEAFSGCTALEELTLPATFTTMGEGALYGSGIKNVLVNAKHPTMLSIGGALYEDHSEGRHLVVYPPGRGEADATISTQISEIDPWAFYRVPALQNVYIDNALPEGNLVLADDESIIHENDSELMHVYVSDGSYDSQLYDDYLSDYLWGYYDDEAHLHIYHPLTISSAGWATLYIGFPTQLPEGCSAYVVSATDTDEHVCTLKNIGRVIPATTPVVIKGEPGLYPLCRYDGKLPDLKKYENRLIGTFIGQEQKWGIEVNQETAITGSVLTLGRNSSGEVGFYKYNGQQVPPYRAYLTVNTVAEARLSINIDDTIDDDINSVAQPLYHYRSPLSPQVYDLQGRKLPNGQNAKGIYIVNGKKVVL